MPFFSAWRNSIPHLSFTCTSMSGTILLDCPSAAVCHMAAKCNVILVEMFNLYCCTTNIHLDVMGQHHKIEGITFGAALMQIVWEGLLHI